MLEKERVVPCPARGMPPTHNAAVRDKHFEFFVLGALQLGSDRTVYKISFA